MHVTLVSSVFPPEIGGPSEQTKQLAKELKRLGICTTVITFEHPSRSREDNIRGLHTITIRERKGPFGKICRFVDLFRCTLSLLAKLRPNVVHLQTGSNLALATLMAARLLRMPTLVKYAGDAIADEMDVGGPSGWRRPARRYTLRARRRLILTIAERVWVTSPRYESVLRDTLGITQSRIWCHPNFIDLTEFRRAYDKKIRRSRLDRSKEKAGGAVTILIVARLKPIKGIHDAIAAVDRLRRGSVRLRIVGGGDSTYERRLRSMVIERKLDSWIEFRGPVAPSEIANEYTTADLFVLPSYEEAFGIVLVEAMAAGVPIVATKVGGVPSVIEHNVNGLLCPAQNPVALAASIKSLIESPTLMRRLMSAGRIRAREYDMQSGIRELIAIYDDLARNVEAKGERVTTDFYGN